jgi:hypothetical protein
VLPKVYWRIYRNGKFFDEGFLLQRNGFVKILDEQLNFPIEFLALMESMTADKPEKMQENLNAFDQCGRKGKIKLKTLSNHND